MKSITAQFRENDLSPQIGGFLARTGMRGKIKPDVKTIWKGRDQVHASVEALHAMHQKGFAAWIKSRYIYSDFIPRPSAEPQSITVSAVWFRSSLQIDDSEIIDTRAGDIEHTAV